MLSLKAFALTLVLAAPALKLSSKQMGTRDSIRRGWQGLLGMNSGPAGIPVTGGFADEVPRDQRFVDLTMSDPLVLQSVSLKYLATLGSFIFLYTYASLPVGLLVALSQLNPRSDSYTGVVPASDCDPKLIGQMHYTQGQRSARLSTRASGCPDATSPARAVRYWRCGAVISSPSSMV